MVLRVNSNKAFKHDIRVYFEDTDAGGIVYHANHLKYMERARTEMSREVGINHSESFNKGEHFFVVRGIKVEYYEAARLDDLLTVHTTITALGPIRMELLQVIRRGEVILAEGHVNLVNVDQGRKPARMHHLLLNVMKSYVKEKS